MAADTETKRRSTLGHTLQFLVIPPVPDNIIGAVDREHVLGIYAGIAPGALVPAGFMWRRTFNLSYRNRYRYGSYSVRGSR